MWVVKKKVVEGDKEILSYFDGVTRTFKEALAIVSKDPCNLVACFDTNINKYQFTLFRKGNIVYDGYIYSSEALYFIRSRLCYEFNCHPCDLFVAQMNNT